MGRPAKYTKKTLEKAVNRYFGSLTRTTPELDPETRLPLEDDNGDPVMHVRQIRAPSIAGLCSCLGITKATLAAYARDPELSYIVEMAKGRIEAWLEEELNTRDRPQGIIFNLQNNYGWREKTDVEVGAETRAAVRETAKNVSLSEKLRILEDFRRDGTG